MRVRGRGEPVRTTGETAKHSVYSVEPIYCTSILETVRVALEVVRVPIRGCVSVLLRP